MGLGSSEWKALEFSNAVSGDGRHLEPEPILDDFRYIEMVYYTSAKS